MINRSPLPEANFVILRNAVVRDVHLSYRASGVLADILSRPDDWHTSAEKLAAARPGQEGIKAMRAALRELEAAGYLQRMRRRGKAHFEWEQAWYDQPQLVGGDVSAGRSISPFLPDRNCRIETGLLKKNREEDLQEDVPVVGCPDFGRFAPSVGATEDEINSGLNDDDPWAEKNLNEEKPRNWRTEDRELFRAFVGDKIVSNGSYWTPEGRFTAEVFYNAFRTKKKPIKWPGRFVSTLAERNMDGALEDWLMDQGLACEVQAA